MSTQGVVVVISQMRVVMKSSNQQLNDRIVSAMLEEFQPLITELKEGISQYSIIYHINYEDLLAKVAIDMMEER